MRRLAGIALALLAFALPLAAQEWSLGVSSGPFAFGDLLERTLRPANAEEVLEPETLVLSAATRPGLSVDIERNLGRRWAVRAEAAFTRAPLSVKDKASDDVALDAGDLDVTTFMIPVVFRINPRGSLRFHVHAGPALANYRSHARANAVGFVPLFRGTRARFGAAFGGGAGWWISERFSVEGNLTDIITSSPFEEDELPDSPGIHVPRPHNVHTTVGVRWRF